MRFSWKPSATRTMDATRPVTQAALKSPAEATPSDPSQRSCSRAIASRAPWPLASRTSTAGSRGPSAPCRSTREPPSAAREKPVIIPVRETSGPVLGA